MSKSEKRTDFWGNEYTQHYDDAGNKVGWSETKTDFWGDTYEQHFDEDYNKTGWSESKTDFWGDRYDQTYHQDGSRSGARLYGRGGVNPASGSGEQSTYSSASEYGNHGSSSLGSYGDSAYSGSSSGTGVGTFIVCLLGVMFALSAISSFDRGGGGEVSRSVAVQPEVEWVAPPAPSEPYSAPYSAQPSFECAGELSWQQRAICSDEALAAQDREAADLGQRVLTYGNPEDVQRINDHWREEWDRCGGSGSIPGCLSWVYREWLRELREVKPIVSEIDSAQNDQIDQLVAQ